MKKKLILAGIAAAAVALIASDDHLLWTLGCNWFAKKLPLAATEDWNGGRSYTQLSYGADSAAQYLDLYVPDSGRPVPLLVLVHGGGFIANDARSRQARFMYRYFRDHGFACASVNYRLAQEAAYPAAVEDVYAALAFLRENAGKYGYDPAKTAIWGESAGGYLAAMAAVTAREIPITALVDYYGIVDFPSAAGQFAAQEIPRFVLSVANGWANGNLEGYGSCEEYWLRKPMAEWSDTEKQESSVLRQAEFGHNPALKTLICHGDADISVPYAQSSEFRDVLSRVYGDDAVELEILHGYGHAVDSFYSDEQLSQVETFLRKALDME